VSKDKNSRREIVDAFSALVARVGEIFGVFDLSFFVAGAVCLGALVFAGQAFGLPWLESIQLGSWGAPHVVVAILASYVLGMVCFAAGRTAGRKLRRDRRLYSGLRADLKRCGLEARYQALLPKDKDPEAALRYALLYTRLWAELRQSPELAPSFNLLTRYWVMAAMCDGLAAALGLWSVVWLTWATHLGERGRPADAVLVLVEIALVGGAVLCFIEAGRYGKYQVAELVATLAHRHVPVDASQAQAQPQPQPKTD
jgi:hypothetical protein